MHDPIIGNCPSYSNARVAILRLISNVWSERQVHRQTIDAVHLKYNLPALKRIPPGTAILYSALKWEYTMLSISGYALITFFITIWRLK